MEIILKHLDGSQQYRLLQAIIGSAVNDPVALPKIIQKIIDEINKKSQ